MKILVTGGAGYIGSHTVRCLREKGHDVSVVDDLSSGNTWAIPSGVKFFKANIGDSEAMERLLADQKFDALVHFAAFLDANESVNLPEKYFENNTQNTGKLVKYCLQKGLRWFVFSSSAAVYGETPPKPVAEETPCHPINPYGASKLEAERLLEKASQENPEFHVVSLRYFNVGGAHPSLEIGPAHRSGVRSLLRIAAQVATGKQKALQVYGRDYDTPDGTCVRDYIHVVDLAEAHAQALDYLARGGSSEVFNVGYSQGHSVLEVARAMQKASGVEFPIEWAERRSCDPVSVVARAEKIKEKLGWKPQFQDLGEICRTAYLWEKQGLPQKL